jgi:RNA-directed DNA polymerase
MINNSIDISVNNLFQCWQLYKKGKKRSLEFEHFYYNVESEILRLYQDLLSEKYKHGQYRNFIVNDNKKRMISVAPIRDRIIHRLLYDYLVEIFDKTFIFDAWSCRKGKGLHGAIDRSQKFLNINRGGYVWRSDVKKFFDSVDQGVLMNLLKLRIQDRLALNLLKEIIGSYRTEIGKGMPIGNLTSQIFANIYLNEFDRFVKHILKPKAYLRYGDDFILIGQNAFRLQNARLQAIAFLKSRLRLSINSKNDIIVKARQGIRSLGTIVYPKGRKINNRNQSRIKSRLNYGNIPSYYGLIKHSQPKKIKDFNYQVLNILS